MSPALSSGRDRRAAIFGSAGTALSEAERNFFRAANPLGFILFQRNCDNPDQVRALVAALRDSIGSVDAPILIDQEGGRVARLKPPHWRNYPAAAVLASTARPREAVYLTARLIAADLAALGVTVDCAPVLDLAVANADPVIGDRAYGADPAVVTVLGQAACEGLLAGGVLPIIKHIPGHGRATVDSHKALPVVTAGDRELAATDFVPFRALNTMPWAMTAHIVYSALDSDHPATLSRRLIEATIRTSIGFDGVLISDDLSMAALPGTLAERAKNALEAGCDVVLHCNGDPAEMAAVAESVGPLSAVAHRRLARGEARRRTADAGGTFDRAAATARLDALLGVRA